MTCTKVSGSVPRKEFTRVHLAVSNNVLFEMPFAMASQRTLLRSSVSIGSDRSDRLGMLRSPFRSTPYEMEPDSNIKRCPRCRFPLEWVAGCAQIMCVNCKHIFCWYCLKSLDVSVAVRLHFPRRCTTCPCRTISSCYISNADLVETGKVHPVDGRVSHCAVSRLGHSRASLFLHRLTIVGIFIGLTLLFLITIPFLILTAPCLLCCRYKQIKSRLKNLTKLGQRFQQQQYTPTAHPSPSSSLNQLNSSSLIDIEQELNKTVKNPLLPPAAHASPTNTELASV